MIYRFGPFRLDPARRLLQHADEQTELPLKVFKCLLYLIEHRNRAVSREELLDAIWGTEHLSAGVVPQTILQVRQCLGDTGQEQHYVGTSRGFGYRWVGPLDVEDADEQTAPVAPALTPQAPVAVATEAGFFSQRVLRLPVAAWIAAVLVLGAIAIGFHFPRKPAASPVVSPLAIGDVALLLPVQVSAGPGDAWIRYGVMDFMAERFRSADQPMVASETVIALVGAQASPPNPQQLDRIVEATGAKLVLAAHARKYGARWTVSLETVRGVPLPLVGTGEAYDVMEAARLAADGMLVKLGRKAPDGPPQDPVRLLLLQQLKDAINGQRLDKAQALIKQVPPQLRSDPELRLIQGDIELRKSNPAAASKIFHDLLAETPASKNPRFRAQVLNELALVHRTLDQPEQLEARLQEAARLLEGVDAPVLAGGVSLNLGTAAAERGQYDLAEQHYARARWNFERSTNLPGLATLDLIAGGNAMDRAKPADALPYLDSAAKRFAALRSPLELSAWTMMLEAQLDLLDMAGARTAAEHIRGLAERINNPQLTVPAALARARLAQVDGHWEAAAQALGEATTAIDAQVEQSWAKEAGTIAAAAQAELALQRDQPAPACLRLRQTLQRLAESGSSRMLAATQGRPRLTLVRCGLAQGQIAVARTDVEALARLTAASPEFAPRLFATLAEAELAAAEGRHDAAQAAYEAAETLADAGNVPAYRLLTVQSHVAWLMSGRPRGAPVPARAWALADSVADRADVSFDAALLSLRIYHALGDVAAWRVALVRARSLAGERRIPPELQAAP